MLDFDFSEMSVRDRLHKEGAFDRKYQESSFRDDGIGLIYIIYILIRESPFLCVGLYSLSYFKNETEIGFNICLGLALGLGVGSRFLMTFFIRKSCGAENNFYRIIVFLLLSAVPFMLIFMFFYSMFSVNTLTGKVFVVGGSFLASTLIESRLFESLR
jgi:magnesium-transporting ATPase (P-type)